MSDPKRIVSDFLATFSTGDVDRIIDALTADATWWVAGGVPGMSGTIMRAQLDQLLRQVKKLYRDGALVITPHSMIVEGDQVACEASSRAVLRDGRVYANAYHFLFKVETGKIANVREYSDTHHMVEIFG